MGPLSFPSNSNGAEPSVSAIPNDQRMAMLAEAFSLELENAQDEEVAPWPLAKTVWFAVSVSAVLWAGIIAVARLFF